MKIVINPSRAIEQINIIYYLILFNIIFKIKQLKRHNMIQNYNTTCLSRNELFNEDWNPFFLGGGVHNPPNLNDSRMHFNVSLNFDQNIEKSVRASNIAERPIHDRISLFYCLCLFVQRIILLLLSTIDELRTTAGVPGMWFWNFITPLDAEVAKLKDADKY